MHHLLADYILSPSLRYEAHQLVYTPQGEDTMCFDGILAASVLATLLSVTDEGEARGIVLDTPEGRRDFFMRSVLFAICGNERLFDLAFGLMVEYMQYLVHEIVMEQIYDYFPFEGPFATWLYHAGYKESYRQRLLSIDWTDPEEVYTFAQKLQDPQSPVSDHSYAPVFLFDGLSAERLLNAYWTWLWTGAQNEAAQYPDTKQKLVEYKQTILEKETNYEELKPEMRSFTPDQLNLFRSWMNQWIDFVKHKITFPEEDSFPRQHTNPKIKQEFFPDKYQTCPESGQYAATRDYILERCKYDEAFKDYIKQHTLVQLCEQLSLMFGWCVVPNHLSKRFKKAQIL